MSDITEKINALCSNAVSLKQCLTDLVTMVRTQAETIASLENTNKKLIQQHDEEIEELTLKLTEKDKELSEVTVENTNLHSNIAHLGKRINNCEYHVRKLCQSVVSLQETNLGLMRKNNELREVVANNQILISKVKSQEEDIAINNMLISNLLSITDVYDKDKELKEREGEIEQLRLKLTETRQKLRDETKRYEELLKSSRKPRVKGGDDLSNQPMEELKSKFSSNEDCEFQDEVIEDINTYTQIKRHKMSIGIGGHGKEDNPPPRKQRKIESCGTAPVVSINKEMETVIVNPLELEETPRSRMSGTVMSMSSESLDSPLLDIPVILPLPPPVKLPTRELPAPLPCPPGQNPLKWHPFSSSVCQRHYKKKASFLHHNCVPKNGMTFKFPPT